MSWYILDKMTQIELRSEPGPLLSFQLILIHNFILVVNIISHNNELIREARESLLMIFAPLISLLNFTWLKLNCRIPCPWQVASIIRLYLDIYVSEASNRSA